MMTQLLNAQHSEQMNAIWIMNDQYKNIVMAFHGKYIMTPDTFTPLIPKFHNYTVSCDALSFSKHASHQ